MRSLFRLSIVFGLVTLMLVPVLALSSPSQEEPGLGATGVRIVEASGLLFGAESGITTVHRNHAEHELADDIDAYEAAPTGDERDEPDIKVRYDDFGLVAEWSTIGRKWPYNHVTYGFETCPTAMSGCNGSNFSPDLTNAQVQAAAAQAFALWSDVSQLTFSDEPIVSSTNPDIIIRFVEGNFANPPFDGPGGVLAHAYYPPTEGYQPGAVDGNAEFDEAEQWGVNLPLSSGQFDLVTVMGHEFGHSVGIAHSAVNTALMAPYYTGPHRYLDPDDVAGVQSLYGASGGGETAPDARVAWVDAQPSSVTQGNSVTVQSRIENIGDATGTININASKTPNDGWTDSGSLGLAPGGFAVVEFNVWNTNGSTSTGTHTFNVNVSVANDPNISNNSGSDTVNVTGAPSGPTLHVASMSLDTFNSRGNVYVRAQVTVKDGGGAPVAGASVTGNAVFDPNGSATPAGTTTRGTYSSGIATLYFVANTNGVYEISISNIAKSGYAYNPAADVDNPSSITVGGGPPPTSPDAKVDSVDASPSTVTQGDSVSLAADVSNIGTAGGTVTVNITKSGGGYSDSQSVFIAAGGSTTVNFANWTTSGSTPTGDHTFTVTVSVAGDSNSANNSGSDSVTVNAAGGGGSVDAAVTSVSATPSEVQRARGAFVQLSAVISNVGDTSGSITVSITNLSDGTYSDSVVINLGAGASQTVNFDNYNVSRATLSGTNTFEVTVSMAGDTNSSNDTGTASVEVV